VLKQATAAMFMAWLLLQLRLAALAHNDAMHVSQALTSTLSG
jgi:hypothetical protein